ncbi:hypothetical protein VPH35_104882 [Triticum aestivum]
MCALISTVIPILEAVVAQCSLPALLYLCEVTEDGSVLAGVELELPGDNSAPVPRREFFWSSSWCGFVHAYEQAALQAISFLQHLYGFVVQDYNYDCMMAYRSSLRSSITTAVSTIRRVGHLERELLCLHRTSVETEINLDASPVLAQFDWGLMCSQMLSSLQSL